MELNIRTGAFTVPIKRDGVQTGTLTLDPDSVDFVQGFYALYHRYETMGEAYQQRLAALDPEDADGILELIRSLGQDICQGIDDLFGAGTSQAAFGSIPCHPDVYAQFFDALAECVNRDRRQRMAPYLPQAGTAEAEPGGDGLA